MSLVAKIRVRTCAQHSHRLTDRLSGAEANGARVEVREKLRHPIGLGDRYRLSREREVETVEVHDHRKANAFVLGQAVRDQRGVQHLLAGCAVELQESAVARGHHVVVIRPERKRARQSARDVHEHEGCSPTRYRVQHLHRVQQPLTRRRREDPHTGRGRGPGGRQHGVLRLHRDHLCGHLLAIDPAAQGFDDLGLRCDGERRDVVGPREARAPRRGGVPRD